MSTLQCLSAAARAVADVPGAIVAAKHTNAQAIARELIIVFVNFVFIVVVSFCLSSFIVLAFLGFPQWEVTSGRSLLRSENFVRRCKNEDSFGRAAETNVRG